MTCVTACGRRGFCATSRTRSLQPTARTSIAGADVAITASYHASYAGFANAGIDADEATRLLALSVDLARRAQPADRQTFVAGSVGLYGVVWANGTEYTGDYSRATDDDVATEQRRRIRAMVDAEADLLAIETIPSGREAAILGELLTEVPGTESWVTFWLPRRPSPQ